MRSDQSPNIEQRHTHFHDNDTKDSIENDESKNSETSEATAAASAQSKIADCR